MDTPSSSSRIGASSSSRVSDRVRVEQEMVDCERDILSLKAAIVDLDHKQYALKTKLNATSPFMAKLPVEVISDIFDLVNESQDKQNTRLFPAPLLLGKICKAWRDIAWTRPRLWSFVSIHLDPVNITTQKRLLREWIGRSGNAPLHIFITFSVRLHPYVSIAKLLLESCSRWKTFVTRPFPALSAEMEKGHHFPNLSFVHINGQRNDDFRELKHNFSKAPQLRRLQLSGYDALCFMKLCWDKLTMVNVESPFHFDEALFIIKRLKAVQKLQFHLDRTTRNLPTTVPLPHKLPSLSDLQIISMGNGIRFLLNGMETPFLTRLEITLIDVDGGAPLARAFEQLYQRSLFSLSHLSLDGMDIKEIDLVSMLELLSSLRSLSLSLGRKVNLSNEMINHFNPSKRDSDSPFLPSLTEFNYKGSIFFTIKALEDMIDQRLIFSQNPNNVFNEIKTLRNLNITYKDKSWTANQARANPNQLQAFYRKIDEFESRDTTLNLVWDDTEKQRLDSDSD